MGWTDQKEKQTNKTPKTKKTNVPITTTVGKPESQVKMAGGETTGPRTERE